MEQVQRYKKPGDLENADAVLAVSTKANRDLFDKIGKEQKMLDNETLSILFGERFDNALIQTEQRVTLEYLQNARKHCSSLEEAMEFIGVPEDQRPKYAELMKEKELQGA